jgi:hypothetical protein
VGDLRRQAAVGAGVIVALLATACSVDDPDLAEPQGSAEHPPRVVEDLPRWQPIDGLSVPRDDFGTVVVDEEIWVLGGMTGDRGNRLDSIEVLDTSTGRWRTVEATMPEGLASFEAAAIGDRVYVFGGLDVSSRASDFAAVLDTSTGRWRRLPPLPTARYSHTVTEHDGRVYVIGGEGDAGTVERVDIFDPASSTWSEGEPMPHARGSHDAVAAGHVIYVLGGWLDAEASDLVQTYDPATGEWTDEEPLPEPMSRAGATYVGGRLWVSLHQSSYVLDTSAGSWSPANPLTLSRHGLGYVPVDGRIYAIGGCMESPLRDVRTVDVLDVTQVSLG